MVFDHIAGDDFVEEEREIEIAFVDIHEVGGGVCDEGGVVIVGVFFEE